MQPGDADVDDEVGRAAEVLGGQLRFAGDTEVGRPGGNHQDSAAARGRRLGWPCEHVRVFLVPSLRQHQQDPLGMGGTRPGKQGRRAGCFDGAGGRGHLRGRLALAVHRLGVPAAPRPVMVQFDECGHGLVGLPVLSHVTAAPSG